MKRPTFLDEGDRVGSSLIGRGFSVPKERDGHYHECLCDCGRKFNRRLATLQRSARLGHTVFCGELGCAFNPAGKTKHERKPSPHCTYVESTPGRQKQPMCFVCYNQPWHRLPSVEADDGKPVCAPNLKCRGCGGRYSEEPANDRSVLGSSGALWENVG